jgi:hypothetical protein
VLDRLWIFLGGFAVILTVVTGSVTVAEYLAFPEHRAEVFLRHSVRTIGWVGLIAAVVAIGFYFGAILIDELIEEPVLALIVLPITGGLYYLGHVIGLPWFTIPDIDAPSSSTLETTGWIVVAYVGFVLVATLVALIAYIVKRGATCSVCNGRLPRNARFCPACGRPCQLRPTQRLGTPSGNS